MSAFGQLNIDKSTKSRLRHHLREKRENTKWLHHIVTYSEGKVNAPFIEFPYSWDIKKSRTSIHPIGSIITEPKENFGEVGSPTFVLSVPTHIASESNIQNIIRTIEDDAFESDPATSSDKVGKYVSIIIGLNNCHKSYDGDAVNDFIENVEKIRARSLERSFSRFASVTIIPFFWKHSWVPHKKYSRHLLLIQGCYTIANSYFRHLTNNPGAKLWISPLFKKTGSPHDTSIPYQKIRDTILHSQALKGALAASRSEAKYVVSLDGDFASLKSTGSTRGVLSYYNQMIRDYHNSHAIYPDVICTGYEAPSDEPNQMIKKGIELDRMIRAAIPGKFVYMTEPNFGFRVQDIKELNPGKLSWTGSDKMHTESRRLIANGVRRRIFEPSHFVYSNEGPIQTEIDSEWRSVAANKYKKVSPSDFYKIEVQRTLRGIRQSYADPQVWASNVYVALQVVISARMSDAIKPLKGIRELFDPCSAKGVRYGKERNHKSNLTNMLSIYDTYAQSLKFYATGEYHKKDIIKWFSEESQISGTNTKESWENFLLAQLTKLKGYQNTLKRNYSSTQIQEIIDVSLATGMAIKAFYENNLPA